MSVFRVFAKKKSLFCCSKAMSSLATTTTTTRSFHATTLCAGLDSYLFHYSPDPDEDPDSIQTEKADESNEIAYWRNNKWLHEYMYNVWEDQGFPDADRFDFFQRGFNSVPVQLDKLDLLALQKILQDRGKAFDEKDRVNDDDSSKETNEDNNEEQDTDDDGDEGWGLDEEHPWGEEGSLEYDLTAVQNALEKVKEGNKVYYDSWW